MGTVLPVRQLIREHNVEVLDHERKWKVRATEPSTADGAGGTQAIEPMRDEQDRPGHDDRRRGRRLDDEADDDDGP